VGAGGSLFLRGRDIDTLPRGLRREGQTALAGKAEGLEGGYTRFGIVG
jgi:hypothetical protein